jgi:transcriptional regulator with XRE-family HTH domain
MEKLDLTQQFAFRLRDSMIAAGFNSNRSPSGVSIQKLAQMTGYSIQICRKYLRGEAIPELMMVIEIATKLNVSPGWLLFGDAHNHKGGSKERITISRNVLHHLFTRAATLYNGGIKEQEVPDFLLELIQDLNLINANETQSKKIIDLAMSSAKHFSPP